MLQRIICKFHFQVGVSCQAHEFHAYGGFSIGVIAGLAYVAWSALLQLCRVDDPTDSVAGSARFNDNNFV